MTIKYGEITIMNNEKTKIESLLYWINKLRKPNYIFLFEDGEICDTEKIVDFHYNFLDSFASAVPVYFEKIINTPRLQIYFDKKIKVFDPLFSNYSKYKSDMVIQSKYNCIYDYCKLLPDKFGLVRIKSTEQMPRYQFAYDSDEFIKEEIVYLIHRILSR